MCAPDKKHRLSNNKKNKDSYWLNFFLNLQILQFNKIINALCLPRNNSLGAGCKKLSA